MRNQSINRNRELINGEAEKRPAPPLSENDTFNTSTASKEKAYSVEEIRQKHSRAYEAWTDQEDNRLKQRYEAEGATVAELPVEFGRTKGAIRSRLKKLGIISWTSVTDTNTSTMTGF